MVNDWRIRSPWEELTLITASRSSMQDRESALRPDVAVTRLRLLLAGGPDLANRGFLTAILLEIEGANIDLTRVDTDWLLEGVERAVADGRLLAIATAPAGAGGGAPPAPKPIEPPETPVEAGPDKTWIEIKLLDFNDRPLAGHPFRLELPDGSVREGTLGSDGVARVTGIDPGTCRLTWKRQRIEAYRPDEAEGAAKAG